MTVDEKKHYVKKIMKKYRIEYAELGNHMKLLHKEEPISKSHVHLLLKENSTINFEKYQDQIPIALNSILAERGINERVQGDIFNQ